MVLTSECAELGDKVDEAVLLSNDLAPGTTHSLLLGNQQRLEEVCDLLLIILHINQAKHL